MSIFGGPTYVSLSLDSVLRKAGGLGVRLLGVVCTHARERRMVQTRLTTELGPRRRHILNVP